MTVRDIAREHVVTQESDTVVTDVVRTMQRESVGSVVIVETTEHGSADDADGSSPRKDDGEPIGLVTDRDLAQLVLDEDVDAAETPVADIVDDELVTVDADAGVYNLVELLSETGRRRVPVVERADHRSADDADGSSPREDVELVGIISLSDVVVLLGMELQHVANAIRATAPAYEQSPRTYYDE